MITTNLTAGIQLARTIVPYLLRQGGGRLMQLSSMGGFVGIPGFSLYSPAKWGIEGFYEGFYEGFAQEVEPFGIHTIVVEPGFMRTGFHEAAMRVPASEPYKDGRADQKPVPRSRQLGSTIKVAAAMIKAVLSENLPRRLLLGSDAYRMVTNALTERLSTFEQQKDAASSTDADQGEIAP